MICGKSICRPLKLNFSECTSNSVFQSKFEKEKRVAYSQEKQQTIIGKLLPCFVTTNLWQNYGAFDI